MLALALGGCGNPGLWSSPGAARLPSHAAMSVELTRPVTIPAGSAHAKFVGGRQVPGVSRLEPYCELEIRTVADSPQQALPGVYPIRARRFTLLRDPVTRLPALVTRSSCSDALFQESLWLLAPGAGNLHSLRCIRPLFHCEMAPPLGLDAAAGVVGPVLRVDTAQR